MCVDIGCCCCCQLSLRPRREKLNIQFVILCAAKRARSSARTYISRSTWCCMFLKIKYWIISRVGFKFHFRPSQSTKRDGNLSAIWNFSLSPRACCNVQLWHIFWEDFTYHHTMHAAVLIFQQISDDPRGGTRVHRNENLVLSSHIPPSLKINFHVLQASSTLSVDSWQWNLSYFFFFEKYQVYL